ncbi:NIL domain-containing protein [Stenomitos frigidus]|uniref:ABC transporter n=1 Tax=Stenomitos frigidus ULC18 TaxID=2107698 RepID=A0A2T1DX14_9CYAN|nr:NIL domain-containing protein [Stenomitos frigidus]PSB25046.1 ABC transporter [Stenomitos frigidus ULC18]
MSGSVSDDSRAAAEPDAVVTNGNEDDRRPTQTRIRIRIPKNYQDEPVISRLTSHYGLTVNITAALLGANARDDGWFDLELRGTSEQIRSALLYFNELDLEIWKENTEDQSDGW